MTNLGPLGRTILVRLASIFDMVRPNRNLILTDKPFFLEVGPGDGRGWLSLHSARQLTFRLDGECGRYGAR